MSSRVSCPVLPDRSDCTSDWVGDIVDAIGEESISSENVTEAILTHIQ